MGYKALKKFQGQNGAGIKAREYLQSLGYDGVNNGGEEYIAFESNQIKKVTNKAPTENPDIRFSKRAASAASGKVTLEVKKNTAEDDYTYDNIAIMLDGKEVGTIGVMADGNEPYLERIDIDEAYRNKGIGTDALRLVAEKYGDFLIAPDNEDAKRLYERYGDESRQETHSQNHSPIIKAARAHFEHGLLLRFAVMRFSC